MKKVTLPLLVSLFIMPLAAEEAKWVEFDAEPMEDRELHREAFDLAIAIRCELEITELRPARYSHPSISLWLSKSGVLPIGNVDDQVARLTIFKTPASENYNFNLSAFGLKREVFTGSGWSEAGTELREFTFAWPNDGTLRYYVGPDESGVSIEHYSTFEPRFWILTVSGAAGQIKCDAREI